MDEVVESYPLPVPIELPRPNRTHLLKRAWRTVWVGARHMGPLVWRKLLRQAVPENAMARPLRLTFEELGATYVKFGQLIGSAPGVFGEAVSDEFRSCLDTGPPVPFDKVKATVEADLGRALDDVFQEFEARPVAAASIAVVHKAVLKDDRTVAVKILRPGIE